MSIIEPQSPFGQNVPGAGTQDAGSGGGAASYIPGGPPAYYLGALSPQELIILPRSWRPDSQEDATVRNEGIFFETIRGARSGHSLFRRRTPSYIFRVPAVELAEYEALDLAVGGSFTDFYWIPDSSIPDVVLHVRKESHFEPVKLGYFYHDGTLMGWWDYTLQLSEEVEPVDISA